MRLHRRAVAAVFLTTAVLTALGPQAVAAPMPWETSKTPTAVTHATASPTAAGGTVTVLCGSPCYQ
ncbi:hypothetical protein [Streptomyces sp. NPDC057616]|uniref:hypothetical protein n=1 Tax=Streptomyces sp. NPDC057616 TaxID=3346183 RepID=UPI00369FCCFE